MPEDGLAIVAGRGDLPRLIAEHCLRRGRNYRVVVFGGVHLDWLDGHPRLEADYERPGRLFGDLRAAGCSEVTFAGGIVRPRLRAWRFDFRMLLLAPRLVRGIRSGDDRTLRLVAAIFEAEGFTVRAPHELLTDLVAPEGVLGRVRPTPAECKDVGRAVEIQTILGAADVGQGVVVAGGICLGLETIQGTDALLDFVARTATPFRPRGARGILYKGPKPGQDLRLDLPAIGPDTLRHAAVAGLAGVAIEAGSVMVLGFGETVTAADEAGIFLWSRGPAQ